MGSNRNEPCPCGSGKKYKKCCLNQLTKDEAIISSELSDALDKPCWYHGTDQSFNAWKLPPPKKPGEDLLVQHTAIFFTINRDFAKEAGARLARVSLSSNARLLDTVADYAASENLRREVMRNPMASRTFNVNHVGHTSPKPFLTSLQQFPLVYGALLQHSKSGQQAGFDIQQAVSEARHIARRRSQIYDPDYSQSEGS